MSDATDTSKSLTPVEVRERLVEALELDIIGPWPGHELEQEMLHRRNRPSNWYLTGFLIPAATEETQAAELESDDDFDAVIEGGGDEIAEDRVAAKKAYFPSSIGLSTLVAANATELTVTVRWGDYKLAEHTPQPGENEERPKSIPVWRRTPREEQVKVPLRGKAGVLPENVPNSGGLQIHALERPVPIDGHGDLPDGTRSISLFLVNRRKPDKKTPDQAYVFQPVIEVVCNSPFVPRPDLRGATADEWDERVNDLHYADLPSYATGHGIATDWEIVDGQCHRLRTSWMPKAEVEKTTTTQIDGVELSMTALGELTDSAAVRTALAPLVEHYRGWIIEQEGRVAGLSERRKETGKHMLHYARMAAERIEQGVEALAQDPDALDAFRVANRAVGAAISRRLPEVKSAAWRPFQLAFILLNIPGIIDPRDPNRDTVDLLFFPTGGGKTEAYLGLAAFTIVLRRLRHPEAEGMAGGGVSVIMRYTLRLLTLDQLSRAAGLVCALELERERDPDRYGSWPFEIGLWVGKAGTPNRMGRKGDRRDDTALAKTRQYKRDPKSKPIPVPIEECPWCQTPFSADSFALFPNDESPEELRIVCTNFDCDFIRDRPLPIVAVDDSIYRRLPAFLIATVDKFAALPWIAESGVLLGGATRFATDKGFAGPGERRVGWGTALPSPLPAPDLVIQDELHLISGPLGTMTGLYETAIDTLCLQNADPKDVRPKIVASTATVRRASEQVQALFGRGSTQVFPPPGPDRRNSFFAEIVGTDVAPARLYVGVASQGRNPKVAMRRVWLALMSAAEKLYRDHGGHKNPDNPVDPYMTVLGYFNALRELGGGRRILEEEVQNTLKGYGARRRVDEPTRLFRDRPVFREVVELTSRVSTSKVAEARRKLGEPDRVDCAIATNMISVGLDIPRLGLMGVIGQPKTAAEYIQATSRVGRDEAKGPGLVVTLLNVHKPRDRSHYERFRHFHETFYRAVEVGSVTPFSARALDRGFAGAIMALARHAQPDLTNPRGVERIEAVRVPLEQLLKDAVRNRVGQQRLEPDEYAELVQSVESRVSAILDGWETIYEDHHSEGVDMQYNKHELVGPKPLLREMLEIGLSAEEQLFRVNRSLRDVEPDVNLFVTDLDGKFVEVDE